ncbi:hypothetical protein AB2M16_11450 [Acetobacter oryzifermentans]
MADILVLPEKTRIFSPVVADVNEVDPTVSSVPPDMSALMAAPLL